MSQQSSSLSIRRLSEDTGSNTQTLSRDEYGMEFARAASLMAKCTRRKIGAAIFGTDHRIVMTGYNGAAAGHPHCTDGACPRGRHAPDASKGTSVMVLSSYTGARLPVPVYCLCGKTLPCPDSAPANSAYDTGDYLCIAIHAEANAIIYADYHRLPGSTIYITDAPCHNCTLLILAAGIREAVIP